MFDPNLLCTAPAWNEPLSLDLGKLRTDARTRFLSIPPPYRHPPLPRWMARVGTVCSDVEDVVVAADTAVRLVVPDGRVFTIEATSKGVRVTPGLLVPPGWQRATWTRAMSQAHPVGIAPWDRLPRAQSGHKAMERLTARTLRVDTRVLNNASFPIQIIHPLWKAFVVASRGGNISAYITAPTQEHAQGASKWSWEAKDLGLITAALRQAHPRKMAVCERFWPFWNACIDRYARHGPRWVGP